MALISNHFKNQIVLLCVALIIVSCLTMLASFWWFSSRYNEQQIQTSITKAQNVFEQYLETRERLLVTAARVLTADFGFKQAVATRDAETISSALNNHSDRINADLMLITDLQGQLLAASHTTFQANIDLGTTVNQLLLSPGTTSFVMLQNRLYQAILLPVKAPRTIAYTLVGFEVNKKVATELQDLTGLDISFFSNRHKEIISSLALPKNTHIHDELNKTVSFWGLWRRPVFNNRELKLNSLEQQIISVRLSAKLPAAYSAFDRLIYITLSLTGIIILLGLALSIWLAKNLSVPLSQLVQTAHQFARGEYNKQTPSKGASTEIQTLFDAFTHMGNEIQSREAEISYQAQHDLLTGLLNRSSMLSSISEQLLTQKPFILVASNIRGFRDINDSFGPQIGDTYLQTIAQHLQQVDKDKQRVHARIGGDEFLTMHVLTEGESFNSVIESLNNTLSLPITVQELTLKPHFCLGICKAPQDGDDAKSLVRRTIIALEAARKNGPSIRYYNTGEDEAHLQRLDIIDALKVAMHKNDGELFMYYQPKLNLRTGDIDKVEALIRWKRPNGDWVSPETFIGLAEQSGLIVQLTQWVIETVVRQVQSWQRQDVFIMAAINISAQDLSQPGFKLYLLNTLKKYDITPDYITLELTERDLMENEQQVTSLLGELKAAGFHLSVDDYGIGQSSLSKIKMLPLHELKIDKAFVLNLDSSAADQVIVQSTIALGHNLGLSVVAEGVENAASLTLLKKMQCDHAQGYLLSRPLPPEQLVKWLNNEKNFTLS